MYMYSFYFTTMFTENFSRIHVNTCFFRLRKMGTEGTGSGIFRQQIPRFVFECLRSFKGKWCAMFVCSTFFFNGSLFLDCNFGDGLGDFVGDGGCSGSTCFFCTNFGAFHGGSWVGICLAHSSQSNREEFFCNQNKDYWLLCFYFCFGTLKGTPESVMI